jgi:hypothetical protein
MKEDTPEAIVESLLSEGDVRSLTMSMSQFDDVFDDFNDVWESLQEVKSEIWGHLAPEFVNKLKSSIDGTRSSLYNLGRVGKEIVSRARAYKPQKDFQDYDNAAHSGDAGTIHGHETPDRRL